MNNAYIQPLLDMNVFNFCFVCSGSCIDGNSVKQLLRKCSFAKDEFLLNYLMLIEQQPTSV